MRKTPAKLQDVQAFSQLFSGYKGLKSQPRSQGLFVNNNGDPGNEGVVPQKIPRDDRGIKH